MRHRLTLAVLAAFSVAVAIGAGGPSPAFAQTAAPALPPECAAFDLHPLRMWIDAPYLSPGDEATVRAGSVLNHHTRMPPPPPEPVPTTCLADLKVIEGAAAISSGGVLSVSPDAPAGSLLRLEARSTIGPVRYETRIVGRGDAALIGVWSQRTVDCDKAPAPGRPVRELGFAPGGRFSVTWTPFETYADYWGEYVHDSATGALRLEVTDANRNPPESVLAGRLLISADGRELVLTGIDLGDGEQWVPDRRCRYEFGRISQAGDGRP